MNIVRVTAVDCDRTIAERIFADVRLDQAIDKFKKVFPDLAGKCFIIAKYLDIEKDADYINSYMKCIG